MQIKNPRWIMSIGLAALCGVPLACDRSSPSTVSDNPPELPQGQGPASQPAPPPTAIVLGTAMQSLQKRAESGDVSSMVILARTLEGMGDAHKTEARQWYQKAADKGDSSAKEALRMMDAATSPKQPDASSADSTTTKDHSVTTDTAPAVPTSKPAGGAVNLDKVRWVDVLASFDNHDFSTVTQPNFHKNGDNNPIFVGVSTSTDKMLTIAASGDSGDDINAVSIVLRIRSHDNLAANPRVAEALAMCGAVTHGNVPHDDLISWLNDYLQAGRKTVPVFRNGWSITVSGTQAEGLNDPKKFLGEAVLIEMKE